MTKSERKKKKRMQLKNKKLIKMYPWLIPRNIWTGEVTKGFDYTWHEFKAMGKGWWKAFGLMLCRDIQQELEKYHYVDKFKIDDCKEKYGELRVYCAAPGDINRIIDKYSYCSRHICCDCGKPDVPIIDTGWILPICKECFEKQEWAKRSTKSYEDFVVDTNEIGISYDVKHYSKEQGDWIETINVEDIVNEIRQNWKKREYKKERDRKRLQRIRGNDG